MSSYCEGPGGETAVLELMKAGGWLMWPILACSVVTRRNSMVVPGGKMGFAMEIILQPMIECLMLKCNG